jgi:TrmH family RNA methyltransferase
MALACDVVLVRPARPANVAAACRAMKNMGLGSLRLVASPDGLAAPEARALAYGAWDVLDAAVVFPTLVDAVADAALVVMTSARPEAAGWTPRRLAAEVARLAGSGRVALVFGPEASGLTLAELALAHVTVRIPTDPAQPSLNLAQAVLLVAYELFLAPGVEAEPAEQPRATAGELEAALRELRDALILVGYLNPTNPDAILGELRALVVRGRPTPREVSLLRGMARQLGWSARRVAGGGATDT